MKIDEIKSVILLAGEYRVLTNSFQALNPGDEVEILIEFLETWLKISTNGVKFEIPVESMLS